MVIIKVHVSGARRTYGEWWLLCDMKGTNKIAKRILRVSAP